VAAIHQATSHQQRVVRCSLSELPSVVIDSPATIVIGAVAAFDVTSEFLRGLSVTAT
jgi:siroheme synthase